MPNVLRQITRIALFEGSFHRFAVYGEAVFHNYLLQSAKEILIWEYEECTDTD